MINQEPVGNISEHPPISNRSVTTPDHPSSSFDPTLLLQEMTHRPGVYRMLDAAGAILYVGKARDLKRRLASYFRSNVDSPKTRALVARVCNVEVTVTRNETEALVLENQLIKAHQPRYNILLRDDKGYLYIYLSTHQEFPRIAFHRGTRRTTGRYFGPYPSGVAVRETLAVLQKLFRLRPCEDNVFAHRTRPCLQHQIGRCTAPCVGLVDRVSYARDVRHTVLFLEGKDSLVVEELVGRMEEAARVLDFEQAAVYRDRIVSLRRVQDQQLIDGEGVDLDVVACVGRAGIACVVVLCLRGGYHRGHKSYFPHLPTDLEPAEVLAAFLPQYYLEREDLPQEILVNHSVDGMESLEEALYANRGQRVTITTPIRSARARAVEMAVANAEQALSLHLATRANLVARFQALGEALGLLLTPSRLECFDVSHTQGEATVVSCVVFGREGPLKSDYRRFNIEGITPGDDFAALYNALTRRYRRLERGEAPLPQVLFIDGGKGQLHQAERVLAEFGIEGVTLVGVAKGPTRTPGLETLFLPGREDPLHLPSDSPALHLIQQVRDEAHRFAITGHRQRRAKARTSSVLEGIAGLGPQRRRKILSHFGGLQEVASAGVEDLARVPGISRTLAQRIYDALHPQ
ncbi:excision nuclease subunit C [Gammaproteobacteria bacterium]